MKLDRRHEASKPADQVLHLGNSNICISNERDHERDSNSKTAGSSTQSNINVLREKLRFDPDFDVANVSKAPIIPKTVPNRPIIGALLITVLTHESRYSISLMTSL